MNSNNSTAFDLQPSDDTDSSQAEPIARKRRGVLATSIFLEQSSPFRKPDWRWLFAEKVPESTRVSRLHELEPVLAVAVAFRSALKQPMSNDLYAKHRETAAAYDLYRSETEAKWQLQARLLAGESNDEIAAHSGLEPTIIEYYEQLFFNVRDRFKGRGWIRIFCLEPLQPFGERAFGWAKLGYFRGPILLEEVLAGFTSYPPIKRERMLLITDLAMKVDMIPFGDKALLKILRLYLAFRELELRQRQNSSLINPARNTDQMDLAMIRDALAEFTDNAETDRQQEVA